MLRIGVSRERMGEREGGYFVATSMLVIPIVRLLLGRRILNTVI
jgi:hypothetical protein